MSGSRPVSDSEFADLMASLGPFGPAPHLVAGVSGGPHSLALVLLAARWAHRRGGVLRAAICDHGLRQDSAAEAAGVAAGLTGLGIPAEIRRLGLSPGPGAQERARRARLDALLAACAEAGAPWLLLGHHRADQAETLLARALAGSGASGLAAMAPVRPERAALVLRPLLGIAPARLEAVLSEAELEPVRDPSNQDERFDRVRLRRSLADPGGEGAAVNALAEAAARFAARRGALAAEVAALCAGCVTLHEAGFARIALPHLGEDAVARALLGALVRLLGGAAYPPAEEAVAGLLARGEGTLGGTMLRRSGLLLREAAAIAPASPAAPGLLWDRRFRVGARMPPGLTIGAAGETARRLLRPDWLPASVVPTLPALYSNGALAVLPALAYPHPDLAARHALRFAPRAGAAC